MLNPDSGVAGFVVGEDELGEYAKVSVDVSVYGISTILKTAYWFTDCCYLYLANQGAVVEVEFRSKDCSSSEILSKLCGEFFNSLIDHSVRLKVLEETASIRDTLLKKAFFDARAFPEKDLVSDETYQKSDHLPHRLT